VHSLVLLLSILLIGGGRADFADTTHAMSVAADHRNTHMDEYLLGCYADLPPREAALAFGSDYDLERDDALWPRPGAPM